MADAMVTGRMPAEKKEEGNRILESLGVSPSKVINQLYDYIIEKRALPFDKPERRVPTKEEVAAAKAWAERIRMPLPANSRFATMTTKEAKRERLIARGLMPKE